MWKYPLIIFFLHFSEDIKLHIKCDPSIIEATEKKRSHSKLHSHEGWWYRVDFNISNPMASNILEHSPLASSPRLEVESITLEDLQEGQIELAKKALIIAKLKELQFDNINADKYYLESYRLYPLESNERGKILSDSLDQVGH